MGHVSIIGRVTAKPETPAVLHVLLSKHVKPGRKEAGCINYDFHADAEDPCAFVVYESWGSQGDEDAHLHMPHIAPLFSQTDRLLSCPLNIRHLAIINEIA